MVRFGLSLLLGLNCTDSLLDRNIQRCLAILIEHEQMMRKVLKLRLEIIPVRLIVDELVHGCIAVLVKSVIMGVNEVAPNVVDGLQLALREMLVGRLGSHLGVV